MTCIFCMSSTLVYWPFPFDQEANSSIKIFCKSPKGQQILSVKTILLTLIAQFRIPGCTGANSVKPTKARLMHVRIQSTNVEKYLELVHVRFFSFPAEKSKTEVLSYGNVCVWNGFRNCTLSSGQVNLNVTSCYKAHQNKFSSSWWRSSPD